MLVNEFRLVSSDFGRSVQNRSSRHGTEPYRPKSELVPYSDVDCTLYFRHSFTVQFLYSSDFRRFSEINKTKQKQEVQTSVTSLVKMCLKSEVVWISDTQ